MTFDLNVWILCNGNGLYFRIKLLVTRFCSCQSHLSPWRKKNAVCLVVLGESERRLHMGWYRSYRSLNNPYIFMPSTPWELCLFHFFVSFFHFFFFFATLHSVWDLNSPTRDQTWDPSVKAPSPNRWTAREFPPWGLLNTFSHLILRGRLWLWKWNLRAQGHRGYLLLTLPPHIPLPISFTQPVPSSALAAATKYHRPGGLNSRRLLLTVLGAGRPRWTCLLILYPVRTLFLVVRLMPSCWVHKEERRRVLVSLPLLRRTLILS